MLKGADALNSSPVLDIKYCDTSVLDQYNIHEAIQIDSPRIDIIRHILTNDTQALLLKAAQLHGHICPGLALGVMSTTPVMQQIHSRQENPEDYTLIAEMQNCPVDGALFITGCTPVPTVLSRGNILKRCALLKNKMGKAGKSH